MREAYGNARDLAFNSSADQLRSQELAARFDEERETAYRNEIYRVRDNGAVLRQARLGQRKRRLDDAWTFGSFNSHSGYFVLNTHVVHRIVATAFHGACPSPEHVVDHIDTNRLNNRAENLRWVTRLENVLLNPITRRRIELAFGSLEAFFANPAARLVPKFEWMRAVSKEEAERSRSRLLEWASSRREGQGGALGEWVFESSAASPEQHAPEPSDTQSLTLGAFQRRWRTPTEFPLCPSESGPGALDLYLERLKPGAVFARNRHGESVVEAAAEHEGGGLSVVCYTHTGVKDWTLARVSLEAEGFCHEAGGTFFTLQGALKAGRVGDGPFEETIDDYA